MRRYWFLPVLPLAAVCVGLANASAPPKELLPDLRILEPASVQLCGGVDPADPWRKQHCTPVGFGGQRLLRFDSVVYNTGAGPLDVAASRPNTATPVMRAVQRIKRTDGKSSTYDGGALLDYALLQDGHPHWHTHGFEIYRLFRLDTPLPGGPRVGHKIGYCFFDGQIVRPELPGFKKHARYKFNGCGTKSSRNLTVGLSIGWGDSYPAEFAGQYVDVTGVPDGDYLLCISADPLGQFRESDEGDNDAWARIALTSDGVSVSTVGDTDCLQQLPYA